MNEHRKLMNRHDPLIILIILSAALFALLFMLIYADFGNKAEVYLNGELIKTLSLKEDGVYILNENEPNMAFLVEDGRIRVCQSDCKDKVCIRSGTLRDGYKTIVCLPNKVVVKIQNKSKNQAPNDVDLVM